MMKIVFLCVLQLFNSIICFDFKCPERGKVGGLKVPNVLSLIDKQTGYHASVEAISPIRNRLLHDYYDAKNQVGFIDLRGTRQVRMNRNYYYHSKQEGVTVRENFCNTLDLRQHQKIQWIRDWFEPNNIVAESDMFKDFVHLGPTGLMIYANKISDKASFMGSEVIEGHSVNHWFYCTHPKGPYIDFYFHTKTSLPYRFSLHYPQMVSVKEISSVNKTQTVHKQVDSDKGYVYNFYMFKPLVISSSDPVPYPLGYGCVYKFDYKSLPEFGKANQFTMDMEAVIKYPDGQHIKSTVRAMKKDDLFSFQIREGLNFVRFIEMPLPLGRFLVDPNSGSCKIMLSDYSRDVKLITRWPYSEDRGFNLLHYLVMKPPRDDQSVFIVDLPLGPVRVQEYKARSFFFDKVDAIVDYYYPVNITKESIPSKVVFSVSDGGSYTETPEKVEVTIINYQENYIDYEDRFDVSDCYQEPGSFTWFQLLFSNPWLTKYNMQSIKEQTKNYLTSFIPIIRIGPIHAQQVDSNIYVTVKLYDRVPFIEAFHRSYKEKVEYPTNIVKRFKVQDCEQVCSSIPKCLEFSYCKNYDCLVHENLFSTDPLLIRDDNCTTYYRSWRGFDTAPLVGQNYLSTMAHVLQQIRNKVSSGDFRLVGMDLSAEELFIVNEPGEIGDISQKLIRSDSFTLLRDEDFPLIKKDHHFNEAQFMIEKSTLNDCFMACLNDDDCNTLSYCINGNKECILSGETSSSLKDTIEGKTNHADGCNIYEKSFISLFHKYSDKSPVMDAISTLSNVSVAECAKTCAKSSEFHCESFDYCENNNQRNVCFLHVNHIEIDKAHELNISNWKFAEAGCSHYSKKSELAYEHKVGLALKETAKESIIGKYDHLSLENCASKCNSDSNCFTLQFCQTIDYNKITDSSFALPSCTLTNLKPSKAIQSELFEPSKNDIKICSIYINHMKVAGKYETDSQSSKVPYDDSRPSRIITPNKSNNSNLTIGLSAIAFILAFASGFIGFKFAVRKGILALTYLC